MSITIPDWMVRSPMLAPNEQVSIESDMLKYPMYASKKMDGFRCLVMPAYETKLHYKAETALLLSRNFKTFDNDSMLRIHFAEAIQVAADNNVVLDCELFSEEMTFSEIGSIVRKNGRAVPTNLKLHCFDCVKAHEWHNRVTRGYIIRMSELHDLYSRMSKDGNFTVVEQVVCENPSDVTSEYDEYADVGGEGIMLRSMNGHYKFGRATLSQGLIFKFKVNATAEAKIVKILSGTTTKEGLSRRKDMFGRSKFASRKDERVEVDRLGGIVVLLESGIETTIGISRKYNDEEFKTPSDIWENRTSLIGKIVEFEYMPVGVKDKPRWGRLLRFRRDKTLIK